MKLIASLLFVPSFVLAATIPMEDFDQSKLEQLLRKIPNSVIKTENLNGFVRKHTQFPLNMFNAEFSIKCSADYYANADVPSIKKCTVDVSDEAITQGDVITTKITDPTLVSQLSNAIPYLKDDKKFYSNERFKALAFTGDFATVFRFIFNCKQNACEAQFSPKENFELKTRRQAPQL